MNSSRLIFQLAAALLIADLAAAQSRGIGHEARLPGRVLASLTVHDVNTCCQRWRENADRVPADVWEPFLERFESGKADISEQLRNETGISLAEMRELEAGPVTIAAVRIPDRPLAVTVMIRFRSYRAVNGILKRFAEALRKAQFSQTTACVGRTCVTVFRRRAPFREIAYCTRDSILCLTTDAAVLRALLYRWNTRSPGLTRSSGYAEVVSHCRGDNRDPLLTWYVDPVGLMKESILHEEPESSEFRRFLLGLISRSGLDQFRAMGGTFDFGCERFASIAQVQLVMAEPRSGILRMFELQTDDLRPPAWITSESSCYNSLNWDLQSLFDGSHEVVSIIEGEGGLASYVRRLSTVTNGFDIKRDLLEKLTGRVCLTDRLLNGERYPVVAVEVCDPAGIAELLERTTERRFAFAIEPSTVSESGGLKIYTQKVRGTQVVFTLVGDNLIFAGHERVIADLGHESQQPLRDTAGYNRAAQFLPKECLLQSYDTFNHVLRKPYEFLRSETRPDQTMGIEFSLLPEFDALRGIFGPSAAYAVPNENGVLFTQFSLYGADLQDIRRAPSDAPPRHDGQQVLRN